MTRAGTEYSQDVIQRAVMFTAMTGTPGDPRSYKYTLAVERLKNEYGIDVPESTLRHWVAAHPDYIGAARIALDLSIDQKLKDIIEKSFGIADEGLQLLLDTPERLARLTATDLKQIITVGAIAFDKKKQLDSARAIENQIEGQQVLTFDNVRRDRDGNIIPQHPGQTELTPALEEAEG